MIDLPSRLAIARSLLGEIDERGFCRCPGEDFHTHKKRSERWVKIGKDCKVYLEESSANPRGVPSIKCQHTSCLTIVEEAQKKLRSEIGKHESKGGEIAPENPEARRKRELGKQHAARLTKIAEEEKERLAQTLGQYATAALDMMQDGRPTSGEEQARALMSLFHPEDVVWCGLHAHSISVEDALDTDPAQQARLARIRLAVPFRTAKAWVDSGKLFGPRISPSSFKPGVLSRSNQFVRHKRFLVIEHDKLPLDEQASLMRWLMEAQGLKLRALIFTGGKSLHGWFDYPTSGDIEELRARLVDGMDFDPSTFNPSHSYRAPGWKHEKTGKPVELWRIHP